MGVPHHPFLLDVPKRKHPAIGVPPFLEPPYINPSFPVQIRSFPCFALTLGHQRLAPGSVIEAHPRGTRHYWRRKPLILLENVRAFPSGYTGWLIPLSKFSKWVICLIIQHG